MIDKVLSSIRERRMPWRLRIAGALLRGFLRDPVLALKLAPKVNIEMGSVFRFKLHIHGRDFLAAFLFEAERAGMKPFLIWGTLLGLIREGGFIAHDHDIDAAILERDYPKKNVLIEAMKRRGYKVRHDVPGAFSFATPDGLLYLDVDVLRSHGDSLVSSSALDGKLSANEFPADAFEPLLKRRFPGGPEVWVPAKPEKILECIYGDWRTPVREYDYRTGPRNSIQDPAARGIAGQN